MKKKYLIILFLLSAVLIINIIGKIDVNKRMAQKGETELMAIEQVKKYLSMLERFYQLKVGEKVDDREWWEGVLSQAAINSMFGIDGRVYRPMGGQVGSSVRSITGGKIIDSKVLSNDADDISAIRVIAQYIFNDPTFPESATQKTLYIKNYYFIEENGCIVIDREETISQTYKLY